MANWLNLKKMENWEFPVFTGFQYDYVTDKDIENALLDTGTLDRVNPLVDWESDRWLRDCSLVRDDLKHGYRVASIVRHIQAGNKLHSPIELDTYTSSYCSSCVPNGHHRVRALVFLGLLDIPFSLSGVTLELEALVRLAGSVPNAGYLKYVDKSLFIVSTEDIKV